MTQYPEDYVNTELNAPNIIELPIDHSIVTRCHAEVEGLLDTALSQSDASDTPSSDSEFDSDSRSESDDDSVFVDEASGIGLYSLRAGWNGDLRWISSANVAAFEFFDRYFHELNVVQQAQSQLGDLGELIMYSGFFVVRSDMTEPYYHVDYSDGVGMNAMTLMTPIAATGEKGNLLYTDLSGSERVYRYVPGKAVAFGADFWHSTEPFDSSTPYRFLCFTFGVRERRLWEMIAETVAHQGLMYRHPELGLVHVE